MIVDHADRHVLRRGGPVIGRPGGWHRFIRARYFLRDFLADVWRIETKYNEPTRVKFRLASRRGPRFVSTSLQRLNEHARAR